MGLYKHLDEPDYINDEGFDTRFKHEVPGKILYGMNMALNASLRSKDESTQFGCYVTDQEGGTIVTSYNSPLRNLPDELVPQTRPEKYDHFEHAERNAVVQANREGKSLKGGIVYITGIPCVDCMRQLLGCEVSQIVYGPTVSKMCESESQHRYDLYKFWFNYCGTKLIKFRYLDGLEKLNPDLKDRIKRGELEINWEFNL